MEPAEILTKELHIFPNSFRYIDNYLIVFTHTKVFRFMLNSFIVAFVSSLVRIVLASLAAFSFTFFEYPGKRLLFYLVVGSMVIPADVLIVQNYFTTAELGLINTYTGMMVVFFISAMNIFIMRQNFMSYSRTLRDAALVDGCGNFRFYARILMPSSMPVVATVFISSFVGTWNTYLWPLLVTNVDEMRTAQVAVTMLNVNEGSSYGPGAVMAAAITILVPSVLIFLIFQKKVVGGMMAGSVKG
ncbi:carbohydrate ABC transporter permease [Dysosmobacter sp. Phy]